MAVWIISASPDWLFSFFFSSSSPPSARTAPTTLLNPLPRRPVRPALPTLVPGSVAAHRPFYPWISLFRVVAFFASFSNKRDFLTAKATRPSLARGPNVSSIILAAESPVRQIILFMCTRLFHSYASLLNFNWTLSSIAPRCPSLIHDLRLSLLRQPLGGATKNFSSHAPFNATQFRAYGDHSTQLFLK
jgi:hypothetical protein